MNVFMMQADGIDIEDMIVLIENNSSASEQEIKAGVTGDQIMISEHFFNELADTLFSSFGTKDFIIAKLLNNDQELFELIEDKFGIAVFGYILVHLNR